MLHEYAHGQRSSKTEYAHGQPSNKTDSDMQQSNDYENYRLGDVYDCEDSDGIIIKTSKCCGVD